MGMINETYHGMGMEMNGQPDGPQVHHDRNPTGPGGCMLRKVKAFFAGETFIFYCGMFNLLGIR